MELLKHQYELEREGLGVSEASRKVINEQENRDNGQDSEAKVEQGNLKVQVKALERENELLQDKLTRQDKQIERLQDRVDNALERGVYAPSFETIEKLTQALNTTPKDLFTFKQED